MWLICINRVRTLVRVTGRLNDSLWVWRSTLFTVATVTLLRQPAVQQHISFWCVVTTRHRHTTQPLWLSELVRASHISCTAMGGGVPLVTSHVDTDISMMSRKATVPHIYVTWNLSTFSKSACAQKKRKRGRRRLFQLTAVNSDL